MGALRVILLAVVISWLSSNADAAFAYTTSGGFCPQSGGPVCDHKEICQLTIVHAVMKSAKQLDGWNETLVSDTCRMSTTTSHCFDECVQMGCEGEALSRMAINQCVGNESYSVRDCARDACKRCGYDQSVEEEAKGCADSRRRRMDAAERQLEAEEQSMLYANTASDNARSSIQSKLEVRPPKLRIDFPTTGTSISQPRHRHLFRQYLRPTELNTFMRNQNADKWEISPEGRDTSPPPPPAKSMPAVYPKPNPKNPLKRVFEHSKMHEGNPTGLRTVISETPVGPVRLHHGTSNQHTYHHHTSVSPLTDPPAKGVPEKRPWTKKK